MPSILFEKIRTEVSRINSIQQSGEKNSSYGKIWISNFQLKKSIKIKKENLHLFPEWRLGRILNWNNYDKNGKLLKFTPITNFSSKEVKYVLLSELPEYISQGWKKGRVKNFNLYDNNGNYIKKEKINHRHNSISVLCLNDFFELSPVNRKIYEMFMLGKSTREIANIIQNISHVTIHKRIKIIQRLSK